MEYTEEESTEKKLKEGRFVGLPWQNELFEEVAFGTLHQSGNMIHIICSGETRGWTKEDLSKYYSDNMIWWFDTNRAFLLDSMKEDDYKQCTINSNQKAWEDFSKRRDHEYIMMGCKRIMPDQPIADSEYKQKLIK